MLKKTNDLRVRIAVRRQELVARFAALEADASPEGALARGRLQTRITMLDHVVKLRARGGGWDDLDDAVKLRLDGAR